MFEIKLNEQELKKLYIEEVKKHLNKFDGEMLFWDTKTLEEKTSLCMNTIKKEFFFDPNFEKKKVGNKWIFPAEKTKEFLLKWIENQ